MSCIWRIWLIPRTNSSLFEGSRTRRRKHFSSCHVKWHGKLDEFFVQEAQELYKYHFLVCFAAIIILLKPVVVVKKWHRFICVCCGRGGLHGLSRLVLFAYVKRKKLRFFIRNNREIVRREWDFSHFTWTSAWADFGHVLGNDTQDTDRI